MKGFRFSYRSLGEFLSRHLQPALRWRRLLGHVLSLTQIVVTPKLRMRSLQLALNQNLDHHDKSVLVLWDNLCGKDFG